MRIPYAVSRPTRPARLPWAVLLAALVSAIAPGLAQASGFAVAATPSRFELVAKPGEVVSRTVELHHVGSEPAEYTLRSADWTLGEQRGLEFFDALQAGSCRPWFRLERRTVRMEPNARRRVRFEVEVPADAPAGECRFALLVENHDQRTIPLIKDSPVTLPMTGRLGVIVYLSIGGAAPKLSVGPLSLGEQQGARVPMITVTNEGNAHGRLDGALRGTDAAGRTLFFPVSTLPVLPGQTRQLALHPTQDLQSKRPVAVQYPITLSGRLDWEKGQFEVKGELK
jgi:fimbrial chaperone protein